MWHTKVTLEAEARHQTAPDSGLLSASFLCCSFSKEEGSPFPNLSLHQLCEIIRLIMCYWSYYPSSFMASLESAFPRFKSTTLNTISHLLSITFRWFLEHHGTVPKASQKYSNFCHYVTPPPMVKTVSVQRNLENWKIFLQ